MILSVLTLFTFLRNMLGFQPIENATRFPSVYSHTKETVQKHIVSTLNLSLFHMLVTCTYNITLVEARIHNFQLCLFINKQFLHHL